MKVGHLENKQPLAPVAGERRAASQTSGATGAPVAGSKVELSSTAAALSGAGSDGSFDAAKVERISKAMREGTYKVNPEAIADKLIANAQELLSRTRG